VGVILVEGGIDAHGRRLDRLEMDCVACKHCQAVIGIVRGTRGSNPVYDSPYRCRRCHAPVCKACARNMEVTKECPGPALARIEHAVKTGRWDESHRHLYSR
jgi:hypothetical protein